MNPFLSSTLVVLGYAVVFICIIQIMNYRNLKKSKEHFKNLHENLKPGVEVMLTDGIYGKLVLVKEDYVILNIAKDCDIKVSRYSIKEIVK